MQKLIDKLSIQVSSLQEGFKILNKVSSVKELARHFTHILRGNLMVVDVIILFRRNINAPWQELYIKKVNMDEIIENTPADNDFEIRFLENPNLRVCMSLPMVDQSQFVVFLGNKFDKTEYSELDKITLQIFIQLLDNAYQAFQKRQKEKELSFSLNHRILQLNSLIDTGIEISRLEHDHSLLQLALEQAVALSNAAKGYLSVKNGRRLEKKIYFPSVFKLNSALKNHDFITTQFKFQNKNYSFYLYHKESRTGIIPFESTDQLLLNALARQVFAAMENHYLHQQALEKQKTDQEISVAGAIQKKLLPEYLPDIEGYDLHGLNIPTKHVGGDYYDCIPLQDGRYAIIIADVSGKGVPAALLVSTLQATMKAYLDSDFELTELAQKLNKIIYETSTDDKYITAFILLLDPISGKFESVNAGHNPVYLIRKNQTIEELKTGGIPLGMMGIDFPFESEHGIISPKDRLLLYTDGVTEAMNEKEQEFDDIVSLRQFILKNNPPDAKQFLSDLLDSIYQFTGDTPQTDDITALYLMKKQTYPEHTS